MVIDGHEDLVPAAVTAREHLPDLVQHLGRRRVDAFAREDPFDQVQAAVATPARHPGEHSVRRTGLANADLEVAGLEHLTTQVDALGSIDRALQAHRVDEEAHEVLRLVPVKPVAQERLGDLPARREPEAHFGHPRSFECLPAVDGQQFAQQPLRHVAVLRGAGRFGVEHELLIGLAADRILEVLEARLVLLELLDADLDHPALNGAVVGSLEVGREERGVLAAVRERQQLAAPTDLARGGRVSGGGDLLIEVGGDHGDRRIGARHEPSDDVATGSARARQAATDAGLPVLASRDCHLDGPRRIRASALQL